ncbi:hypothetical protein [Methanogenium cariaci]|uniref:hypothetical protein n=1 Tax=Methanogenium cariaci TaxID=2197 RepID=UPI001C45DA7A|nr:hypothetical protein [Methanogenium cariaci]
MSDEKETPPCSLSTIYFYLTPPECNLACRHCWISPTYKNTGVATEYLPLDQFISIVEEAAPPRSSDRETDRGGRTPHPPAD